MAENYYYMWEMATSLTIIVLVVAYFVYDRLKLRYAALEELARLRKTEHLNSIFMSVLGGSAAAGGTFWVYYIATHRIYISEGLMGPGTYIPPLLMGTIGLAVLVAGLRRRSRLRL